MDMADAAVGAALRNLDTADMMDTVDDMDGSLRIRSDLT